MKYKVGTYEEVEELSKPLPAGTYEVEVFSGKPKTMNSKKGGTIEGFEWILKVINNEDQELNGSQLFHNSIMEGKARIFLQQFYSGCGVKWEGSEIDLPDDLLGRTCFVEVENGTYNGKPTTNIKSILAK